MDITKQKETYREQTDVINGEMERIWDKIGTENKLLCI